MRDHIAHGYFDINTDLVWDVVKNDLAPLRDAIDYFIEHLYEIVPSDSSATTWFSTYGETYGPLCSRSAAHTVRSLSAHDAERIGA